MSPKWLRFHPTQVFFGVLQFSGKCLNPHPVATLCSSFSRENGHVSLSCSSRYAPARLGSVDCLPCDFEDFLGSK